MTNAETILKLNEALSTLIKAYEELQGDNTSLKNRINELEDEVLELESTKEDLEKNVDELKDHTQKDKSNISTMLGKIESILNKKSASTPSVTSSNTVTPEASKVEEKKDDIFSNLTIDSKTLKALENALNEKQIPSLNIDSTTLKALENVLNEKQIPSLNKPSKLKV